MSSQIEGTQATLEDIFDPMIADNTNRNVADVVNYIKATEYAINRLKTLPLYNRLIKETHAALMGGVRGQEKSPGEFRYSQNWIGGQGSTIKTARYIPPHPEDMVSAMSDLEEYLNHDDSLDSLIRVALIHYQFETIHPFLDGNGRIGRLLITLFLTAIDESAQDAILTIDDLTDLKARNETTIKNMGRASKNVTRIFQYLESNPIIDIGHTAEALGISFNTVSSAVKRMIDAGILIQTENASRNHTFAYIEYLNILRKGM